MPQQEAFPDYARARATFSLCVTRTVPSRIGVLQAGASRGDMTICPVFASRLPTSTTHAQLPATESPDNRTGSDLRRAADAVEPPLLVGDFELLSVDDDDSCVLEACSVRAGR
jgi:hypothetical protein